MEILSKSTDDTKKLAERVAKKLRAQDAILLYGNLGSGKTTFTQFLAKALGSKDKVVSPTFILQKEYKCESRGIKKINHFDLYRITDEEEITKGGFLDFLNEPESISVIEWPEKIEKLILSNSNLDSGYFAKAKFRNDNTIISERSPLAADNPVIPERANASIRDPWGYIKITFEYVSENERKINVSNLS